MATDYSEIDFKQLIFRQIERINRLAAEMGSHYGKNRDNYHAAIMALKSMLSAMFEDDAKARKGAHDTLVEFQIKAWEEDIHKALAKDPKFNPKDFDVINELYEILMSFLKRQNLLIEQRIEGL